MVSGNLAPLDVIGTRTVLLEAFTGADPESVKIQLSHQYPVLGPLIFFVRVLIPKH